MDIGARLRQAREARGLTIDAVSRTTRVQPRVLSAIEQNDSFSLPPRPYGRGFVRAYAAEVGLDPDATVREFFSQFAVPEEMPAPAEPIPVRHATLLPQAVERSWIWPVSAVVAYAAIGALVILIGSWALQRRGEPGAVATAGASVPAAAATVERQPAPPPPPASPARGVAIVLAAERPVWVTATVDGRRAIYRTLEPGEQVNLAGTGDITIRTGDAGALKWQVNKHPAVPMGEPGEVRTYRVTPENAARVK